MLTKRVLIAPLVGIALSACASIPTAVTRSPQSPAHPAAPEAATPPASRVLTGGEAEPSAPPSSASTPQVQMHEGHGTGGPATSSQPGAASEEYTCTMHPEVKSDKPGTCPICGMTLVKREKERQEDEP